MPAAMGPLSGLYPRWRAGPPVMTEGEALGASPSRSTRRTGLEPATTGSTGRYSNQLSYRPMVLKNPLEGSDWTV